MAGGGTSKGGEEQILLDALETIGESDGWCVEFGAHDGRSWSNTYGLITERGFSAVLIEPDAKRFAQLVETHAGNERVLPVRRAVGFGASDGLDSILAGTPIPDGFDVLSIDIDGNDYHAWKAVRRYRPKLVVIEFNPTIPTGVEFVQVRDPATAHGSSITSLVRLGREKGYRLIAATEGNAIFVRDDYFARFGIADGSPERLRPPSRVAYLFQGYDGTVFVAGAERLLWHDWSFNERRFQQLPRLLRKHPDRYTRLDRLLLRLYRRWYLLGLVRGMATEGLDAERGVPPAPAPDGRLPPSRDPGSLGSSNNEGGSR
jgi:hypothetical protein